MGIVSYFFPCRNDLCKVTFHQQREGAEEQGIHLGRLVVSSLALPMASKFSFCLAWSRQSNVTFAVFLLLLFSFCIFQYSWKILYFSTVQFLQTKEKLRNLPNLYLTLFDISPFWVAVRTFSMTTSPGKLALWANVFIPHLSMLWLI